MSAVETIGEPLAAGGLMPTGSPVVAGRVHLGRLRGQLPTDQVAVLVGFGALVWLGGPEATPPELGRLVYRAEAAVDRRGRVVLDRRARAWLAVADTGTFEALVMPAPAGGVLVVADADAGRMVVTGLAGLAVRQAQQDRGTARQLQAQADLGHTTHTAQRHRQARVCQENGVTGGVGVSGGRR